MARRKYGELVRCRACPSDHPGWKRGELRNRRRDSYCPKHLADYDAKNKAWPHCPKCKGDNFTLMRWGGEWQTTVVVCEDCGHESKASRHFDETTIKVMASPIKRFDDDEE